MTNENQSAAPVMSVNSSDIYGWAPIAMCNVNLLERLSKAGFDTTGAKVELCNNKGNVLVRTRQQMVDELVGCVQ